MSDQPDQPLRRNLLPPENEPDEDAQQILTHMRAYAANRGLTPLQRALGFRHFEHYADTQLTDFVYYARHPERVMDTGDETAPVIWDTIADTLTMTYGGVRSRNRRAIARIEGGGRT
jgi:hypothetical protein